jgi:hypothetical protein
MPKSTANDIIDALSSVSSWATAAYADGTKEAWKAGKGLAYKEEKIGFAKLLNFGGLFGPLIKAFLSFGCPGEKSPELEAIGEIANTLNYFQAQTNAKFTTVNRKIDLGTITPLVQEQITMQKNFRTVNGGSTALNAESEAKKYFNDEIANDKLFDYNAKQIYNTSGTIKIEDNGNIELLDQSNTAFVGDLQRFGNALTGRVVQGRTYNSFDLYAAYMSLAHELNTETFADREKWNETMADDWAYLVQVASLGIYADALRCEKISIGFDKLLDDKGFWQDKTSSNEKDLKDKLGLYSSIEKAREQADLKLFGLKVSSTGTADDDYRRTYGVAGGSELATTTPLTDLSQKVEQAYNENKKTLDLEKNLYQKGTYYSYAVDTSFVTGNSCPLFEAVLSSAGGKDAQIKKQKGDVNHWGVARLPYKQLNKQFILDPVMSMDQRFCEQMDNDPQGYDMSNALSGQQLATLMDGLESKKKTLEQLIPEINGRPVYGNQFNAASDDHGVTSGFLYWEGYDLDGNYYRGTKLDPANKVKHAFHEDYSCLSSKGVGNRFLPVEWNHDKTTVTILKKGQDMKLPYLIN